MYVDMFCRSLVVSRWSSAFPRKGSSSSAMRVGSMRVAIVDGWGEISNRRVGGGGDREASQARGYCVAKNATHRAARLDASRRK